MTIHAFELSELLSGPNVHGHCIMFLGSCRQWNVYYTQHWQQSSQSARSYFGMCTHWRSTDASRGNLCTLTPQRTFCNRTFFESWLSLSILTTYIRFARGCNTNITMRRHVVWARTMVPLWRHICLQAQNRKIKVCFLHFIKYQIYYIFFQQNWNNINRLDIIRQLFSQFLPSVGVHL